MATRTAAGGIRGAGARPVPSATRAAAQTPVHGADVNLPWRVSVEKAARTGPAFLAWDIGHGPAYGHTGLRREIVYE